MHYKIKKDIFFGHILSKNFVKKESNGEEWIKKELLTTKHPPPKKKKNKKKNNKKHEG